jgi:hypothetical protein
MRTQNVPLFKNFLMEQDGYSSPYLLELVTGYSIQAYWTGTPTGILFIEVCNDPSPTTPVNWSLMNRSIIHVTNGGDLTHIWKQYMAPFRWIRFGYAFGGGTGTLNANLNCKGTT